MLSKWIEETRQLFIGENVAGQKNRLPLSQCANCCVCGGKRTAIDRRKKTRMISRGALVIGICEHIRALCLKKGFVKRYVNVALSAAILFVIFERERECLEGENSSGAERVKSHGQYWVGRDKIVHNLLEGTRYRGIEMRAKMASGKGALGIM
ncbi:hypothetical protein T4B_10750 [Trichinella pseudospiralis]|uniref:Uncharacterized protein n=1 Tax=Trichinella pseudospiralis TaxID=6337 RepID=A0A0V1H396_TRIPS|nr:hypothetical protein T4B_10750 [Trichinella pseudospiralis]